MVGWGVQKTFSDAFGFYSIWNRLWPEKPVGATKLIGPCDKQQKESVFAVKYFYDLLDTNCTTNTKNSLEAFYYGHWSESGQRCVNHISQIISEDTFIMLLNLWLLGFVNHVSARLNNAPMDLLEKYTPLLLLLLFFIYC